jgi:hypothetical protein
MILSLKIPPRGKVQSAYPFAAKQDNERERQD